MKEKGKKKEKVKKNPKEILKNIGIGVLLCVWACVAFYIVNFVISYLLLWILGKDTIVQPLWTTVHSALVYSISAVVIILTPAKIDKKWKPTREKLGLTELPTFTDIGLSILGFFATILISGIVINFLQSMHLIDGGETQNIGYSHLAAGFERIVAFIALVIVAPIAEELIYRGWLYDKIKSKACAPIAIVLVSIAFGVMHGQWNVGITVGIMSIVMCIERELTGTIYAGILTHMFKNGIAFAFLILQGVL